MKRFSTVAVTIVFAALFVVSATAQTAAQKMAVIDTGVFGEKDGIVKYTVAMTALNKEFTVVETELQTMAARYQKLAGELKVLQDNIAGGKVPVDQASAQAKAEEYQSLELQLKRKQEDGKASYDRRRAVVMRPVLEDLAKAMQEFATKNGYDMIFDGAKLDEQQLILAFIPTKLDVTKEFITFYNARPATTATAAKPK